MSEDIKSVPVNLTEARFIIKSMNTSLSSLSLIEKVNQGGLKPHEEEERFQANSIKRKFEIMFEDELKK